MSTTPRIAVLHQQFSVLSILVLLFAALAPFGLASTAFAENSPTITTAKNDYVPAELVDINGAGWQPGEVIELFVDDFAGKSWQHSATVTADEEGSFYYEFRLPDWFVAVYSVSATGATSGVAETQFDDSIAQGSFGTNHNSGNSELTISAPATAAGSVLIAHMVATDSVSSLQFCPVQTGWNTATSGTENLLFRDTQNKVAQQVFWRVATSANSSAVSYNFNFRTGANCTGSNESKGASGGIIAFSGVDTTDAIDAAGGTGGTSSVTSGNAPSVTTTTANTHVLRFFGLFKNASIGPSAQPPRIYSINSSSGKERAAGAFGATQAAAGATGTFTGTFGSSGEWVAQTVALKMAAPTAVNTSISEVSGSGTYAGTATLTAKLSSGGSGVSGKTVSFKLNNTPVGSDTTDSTGVASLSGVSLSGISSGTYNNAVTAEFAGDAGYGSSSGQGNLTVDKAASSIAINNIPASATVGGNFTPAYTSTGDGTKSTTANTPTICSVSSGVVSFDAAGTCKLQASISEGTNYAAATGAEQSFTIAAPPKTDTSISDVSGSGTYGGTATLVATLKVGTIGLSGKTVSFKLNNTPVGSDTTDSTGVASLSGVSLSGINAGTHIDAVEASFTGDSGYNSSNSTGDLIVATANQATLSVTGPSSATYGDADATITTSGGSGTGVITFDAGTSTACSIVSGKLHVTAGTGTCSVTATKAADNNHTSTTSSTFAITINKDNQATLTVTQPTSGSYGDKLTMSASGGSGTGALSFNVVAGSTACAIITSGPDTGKLAITSGTGTCSVTATKAADNNYNSTTSAAHTVTISKATPNFTFNLASLPSKTFGDASFSVASYASTNSTGAITFALGSGSVGCSVTSAGQVTITGATGTSYCIISASLAADANYNAAGPLSQSFNIAKATTSLLYTGAQLVIIPNTLTPITASVSSAVAGCKSSGTVTFSLDRNPTTGASGNYTLNSATPINGTASIAGGVSTSGWQQGVYTLKVTYTGANCADSQDEVTLTVGGAGDAANGGGWTTVSSFGRLNFGFTVQSVPNTSPTQYKGQFVMVNNGKWRLKGTLSSYTKTSTKNGAVSGTGDLFSWDQTLNGGLGGWKLVQSGVSFTASFTDNGTNSKTSPDTYGQRITYSGPTVPNFSPMAIKGGNITAK